MSESDDGRSIFLREEPPLDLTFSEPELEQVRDHITDFIAATVDAAGAEGAVLGLSGGIDSTTTAYLAVEALGPDGVHGLLMPSEVNDPETMSDAERVAEALGIEYDVIEIQPIAETFFDQYSDAADDRMAAGNVYVRTRAVLNYFVANHENRIVLGTGNRSEAMTGYFTKYGDQAVDCNPIGNLYKMQVRQLAAHLGVPQDLVMQTPTAGMWIGQTDEEEMGVDYDTLDGILALHVDGPLSADATVRALDVTAEQVDRVVELVETSKHKRSMPPAASLE
ncbi:NAD+ synthase [Halalkaliarchaeum sp. AArc-GB]|uniref:NAD+ synthase n=1 Tax=Halalkaliarchaeum sp. AArc-GB TaxID=3074078 RepID=UPI00285B6127|nr:NAD+ synthase [Halalkaliarchaeum sp. AArc-GB]MDR5672242.1 NAD+ synthase [Halalkaliarchaeum sp. AArc-GB]